MRNLATFAAALMLIAGGMTAFPASAAPSCTDWMDQGNGTSWATCVGDDGVQRCYLISNTPGSIAYEVNCSA
ncbi:MAG TPA: hypothetical protein VGA75_04715 [Paracoccaceae bacterium]